MSAYYNEYDPYAAEWLRNLIAAGHIAPGDVDERSIEDVRGEELRGYSQVHLFAGVGGWSLALRMAGWGDGRPVWTGSCPCQPFSVAGRRGGTTDARHLWPEMRRLIAECRPEVVFGEQVASAAVVGKAGGKADGAAGPVWIDGVFADLEAAGYTCGACVLPAAGVLAPHIRQRLWWCAERLEDAECCRGAGSVIGKIAGQGRTPVDTGAEGLRQGNGASGSDGPATHGPSGTTRGLAYTDSPDGRGAEQSLPAARDGSRDEGRPPVAGGVSTDRLADAELRERGQGRLCDGGGTAGADGERAPEELAGSGGRGKLVYPERDGRGPDQQGRGPDRGAATGGAGAGERRQPFAGSLPGDACEATGREQDGDHQPTSGVATHWGSTWLVCSDGTARRVVAGVPPLAHGLPRRVDELRSRLERMGVVPEGDVGSILKEARRCRKGVLKGMGNAIVPQVASEFIKAYMDTLP